MTNKLAVKTAHELMVDKWGFDATIKNTVRDSVLGFAQYLSGRNGDEISEKFYNEQAKIYLDSKEEND